MIKIKQKISVFLILTLVLFAFASVLVLSPNRKQVRASTNQSEFVTTENGKFKINNRDFRFVGTNNYYLHYKDNVMIDSVLDSASAAGFSVIRMWGFFDGFTDENINNKAYMQSEQGVFTKPGGATSGFQDCWERLDYTVNQASLRGIKLIIVFTNYWNDFGGIAQYLDWAGLDTEDKSAFYTNADCRAAYKNYVSYLLNRENQYTNVKYKDDPTIMAWELMNEPRNQYKESSIFTAWAKEMSAYVKSIDSNHLLAVGDEGSLSDSESLAYNGIGKDMYSGDEGVDFDELVVLDDIDFGTFHMYPDSWGASDAPLEWGSKWIKDHIDIGKKHNKPVILEEFGISALSGRNRELIYSTWAKTVYDNGGAGLMFWMLAGKDTGTADSDGNYPDYDGFRLIYDADGSHTAEMSVLVDYAKLFSGQKVTFKEKVHMISPYLTSREDEKGDVRFVEINSDETPIYKVQAYVQTAKKIKWVEIYTNGDYIGDMTYNAATGYYEYDLEMKYYVRGMTIDIDVTAVLKDKTKLSGERTRVLRIRKFDYGNYFTADYSKATEPVKGAMTKYSSPAYEASYKTIQYAAFGDAYGYKINAGVTKFAYWCELKTSVSGIATELQTAHRIKFDVYIEKDACAINTAEIPESPEGDHISAPGFRNYVALEPGWIKTGLNLNNTKTDGDAITEVTIDGKTYYKQTVVIPYTSRPAITELVLGVVFNHVKFDGEIILNNLALEKRVYTGNPLDGYEVRGEVKYPHGINYGLIIGLSVGGGVLLIGGTVAALLIIKKRKKATK